MMPAARPGEVPDDVICSGKGCREPAQWALRWNNPRIHSADRRKIWLACDDHREHLTAFLDARGFLRDVIALKDLDDSTER